MTRREPNESRALRRRAVRIGFVLAALAAPALGGAYQLHFDGLSLDEGLSQVSVNVVFQDHKGFIWIGTRTVDDPAEVFPDSKPSLNIGLCRCDDQPTRSIVA